MKNKNWIKLISESYIQLNEEMDIFDENLWGELVQGNSKPGSGLGIQSVEQQRMLSTTPTTTTTKRRRVATGGASSTT